MTANGPFQPALPNAALEGYGLALATDETDSIADLMVEVQRGAGAIDEPLLRHIVDAAERLAIAWRLLRRDANGHGRAPAATRDRAWRVMDQLQSLVSLARDTLSTIAFPLPAEAAAVDRDPSAAMHSPSDDRGSSACGHPVNPAARETPSLVAYLLGPFQVLTDDVPIEVWPNGKSKAVLKYLLLNRKTPVAKEVLMDLFWPEADPESARNSLNVSIHRLRRALAQGIADFPFVVFRDGRYTLNPKLTIWTDADAFMGHLERARELERAGSTQKALDAYAACVALYNSELLPEDRYDDWLAPLRQKLRDGYLAALVRLSESHFSQQSYSACMADCTRILTVDACDEKAHRALMRCYARLCQPQLAQRQYQLCVQTLSREMSIPPSAETTDLYRRIARREAV